MLSTNVSNKRLHQFSKFKTFLWVWRFFGKKVSNFVSPELNSTTGIAITNIHQFGQWCVQFEICGTIGDKIAERSKDWGAKKVTKVWVGHVTTISGHCFANHINIFHKTQVLRVILGCLKYLSKFQLEKKVGYKTIFVFDQFWSIFRQLHKNISQNKQPFWGA